MAKVEMYSSRYCPFCHRAKRLLQSKGVEFIEIDVDGNSELRAAMRERANGRHTVPQIFIDDRPIGGCDELHALDRDGKLDPMLEGRA